MKQQFVNAQHWSIDKWISVLAIGGEQKKRFSILLESELSHRFMYLRAFLGHSGSTINPSLKDNVVLPEGFTENIYHVGNGKELRSIVNHGLFPGGISLKTGRQAVFFTAVNLMGNQDGLGEALSDLSQARIAPYKNTCKHFLEWWKRLVGQGFHHTSLHTLCAHAGHSVFFFSLFFVFFFLPIPRMTLG